MKPAKICKGLLHRKLENLFNKDFLFNFCPKNSFVCIVKIKVIEGVV